MIEAISISLLATLFAYLARYDKYSQGLKWSFVLITSFLSLSYNWGNDVKSYMESFHYINSFDINILNVSSLSIRGDKEYGWIILNFLCKPIGFFGFRIILFIFENWVIYKLIKENVQKNWYWLAVFIYTFNTSFMILGSSMMRQWLAICIVALAVLVLQKRKKLISTIISFLLILLAYTFHKSAIICIPIIFLSFFKYNLNRKCFLAIILFFILWEIFSSKFLSNLFINLLQNDFSDYKYYEQGSSSNNGTGFFALLNQVFYFLILASVSKVDGNKRIFIILTFLSLLFVPLLELSNMASRISYYFSVFSIAALPLFFQSNSLKKGYKQIILIIFILLTFYNYASFFNYKVWQDSYSRYYTILSAPNWE